MAGPSHYTLPPPVFDTPTRVLIVIAPYYKDIADDLLAGAKGALEASKAMYDVLEEPGALEVPTAIAMTERAQRFDGFVALGCVIRGETTHYETVCNDSSRGLMLLGLNGVCLGNGIVTVENHAQAAVRADPKGQNKGGGAAEAACHLIQIARDHGRKSRRSSFAPDSEQFLMAGIIPKDVG